MLSVVLLHVPKKVPVLVTSIIGGQEPLGVSFQDLKATRPRTLSISFVYEALGVGGEWY